METVRKLQSNNSTKIKNRLRQTLKKNIVSRLVEILLVFFVGLTFIQLFKSNNSDEMVYNQAIIWVANILMLLIIWIGLRIRGQGLESFGFSFKKITFRLGIKVFFQSLIVFLLALTGFVIGSIIMANIVGIPESSNMSGYDYIKSNIWMLLLSLGGVYIVSSFGEEVIYRAFLINRISSLGHNIKRNNTIAVIASAIIFGLVHYNWGPMGIVQTTFMGLVLGMSYIYLKKRIWVLIIAHAYMDTILIFQMYFG